MGERTEIAWTDATFNPWSGCTKVSPACAHCYAESLPPGMRRHAEWGDDKPRVMASESYWKQPLAWDRKAEREGKRTRVFCGSTCDVFERSPLLDGPRWKLWALIEQTHHLDWLLLTKRADKMAEWARQYGWPSNAWAGVTVENQEMADLRIPLLLQVPAAVRFVSAEPLLGPVDLDKLWCHRCGTDEHVRFEAPAQPWCVECDSEVGGAGWLDGCASVKQPGISWLIAGGESGPNARPSHPDWFRSLRDQCQRAGVPFFFKQWGEWAPGERRVSVHDHRAVSRRDGKTGEPTGVNVWTGDGSAYTAWEQRDDMAMVSRVGRTAAGHLLDGVEHREVHSASV